MHLPEPDSGDPAAPRNEPAPSAGLLVPPARFWAILYGAEPTAEELEYIRGREAMLRIACTVLRERRDPRLRLFDAGT